LLRDPVQRQRPERPGTTLLLLRSHLTPRAASGTVPGACAETIDGRRGCG